MRMMEELLSEIRGKSFFPDESRAGRLVDVNLKDSAEFPVLVSQTEALSGKPVQVKE